MIKKPILCWKSWNQKNNRVLVALLTTLFFCGACSTLQTPPYSQQDALNLWTVKGRISVKTDQDAFSGNLFWQREASSQEFKIFGPFGKLYASLTEGAQGSELYIVEQGRVESPNSDSLIYQAIGIDLPLSYLIYWVQGRQAPKAPGTFKLDRNGRLEYLEYQDWRIYYYNYQYYGDRTLPSKIRIEKSDQLIKLSLRDWKI